MVALYETYANSVNVLTVIASESYDSFAKELQSEIAEALTDRPRVVTAELFIGKIIKDTVGNEQIVDSDIAHAIHYDLVTVQNPFGFVPSCCAKQRIKKTFSALICCYFVDKNDDFLFVYQPCG